MSMAVAVDDVEDVVPWVARVPLPEPYYDADGITLYCAESLATLMALQSESVDSMISDPPYSSGGLTRSDRAGNPTKKYVQTGTEKARLSFSGDNRDGRGWLTWCGLWLGECLRIVRESGYALTFTDWRMLPLSTDALQVGGWVWRGILSWDKTEGSRAPHTGYFRHQCEFVTWGTRGVSVPAEHGGPWPGMFRYPVLQSDKFHITGKPTQLMRQLVQCVPPGGLLLDPFAGSGTTLVAARLEGRRAIGIEQSEEYCEAAVLRLKQGLLAL